MRKIILTEAQLIEYVERKKAEKVFYEIVVDLHSNRKNLNESISVEGANQSVIDNYKRKNLITPAINEMLIKYGVINEKKEII
jgi:hypothetical protein